jgi:predicted regulator of Ras-like GTPase activity (Roadblock/LC7/MglB family)
LFKETLKKMVDVIPGARGAIFADWEGESVDFHYPGPEYDIKLVGAHQGILLGLMNEVSNSCGMGEVRCMLVGTSRGKLVVRPVKDGYYLGVLLGPYANGGLAMRAVDEAAAELMDEI